MKIDPYEFLIHSDIFGSLPQEAVKYLAQEASVIKLASGEYLIRQNEEANHAYLLCTGRLIAFHQSGNTSKFLGEVFPYETVGEMALLVRKKRSASIIAARSSVVLSLPITAFLHAIQFLPEINVKLAQLMVKRSQINLADRTHRVFKTVTIVKTKASAQHQYLVTNIEKIIQQNNRVMRIDRNFVMNHFSKNYHEDTEELSRFFSSYEIEYDFVIFDGTEENLEWQKICVQQSDIVLVLDDYIASEHISYLNHIGFSNNTMHTYCYLVCLHEEYQPAKIHDTHPSISKIIHVIPSQPESILRLTRFITGKAFGILLGGGAARGLTHIGVLKALEEHHVNIDVIGGVSSGSIIAAQYAMGYSIDEIISINKAAAKNAEKFWTLTNITYTLLHKSNFFQNHLKKFFGDIHIENLTTNYFAVSCDLSTQHLHVHDRGLLREALYASNAILPFMRPSVINGHLYIDGGYINSVPGDIMQNYCYGITMGVNVGKMDDLFVDANWTDLPSNAEILWNKINPFSKKIVSPNMLSNMMRAIELGRDTNIAHSKKSFHYFLTPPVEHIGFLEYSRINEFVNIGYMYTKKHLETLAL